MDTERNLSRSLAFGSFLSENAEAFGLVSDAHPVTTSTVMIAANGHAADDGMHPPTFSVSGKGVDGLYDGLYSGLLHRSDANEAILRLTFGESEGRQTHPIARYSAALVTSLAYQTLSDMTGAGGCDCAASLSSVLPDGIDSVRDVMRAAVGPRPGSEHFFAVSFCACRVTPVGEGNFGVDIFHAGDFSLYILDEKGMAPLYVCDSDMLEPLDTSVVSWAYLELEHPEPFALLLLSKSVLELSTKDFRAMQDRPGMIWRYRMRSEDQWLRLVTSTAKEEDLAENAERFFAGRAVGRDSASGAWLILNGSYDAFRTACRSRLHQLEHLISLLPKGYDALHPVEQSPLGAFRTRPGLVERTMDAIAKRAASLLHRVQDENDIDFAGSDGALRLTAGAVREVFLSYDCKNQADRQQIEKNKKVICDLLSEHWTTLRPLFCRRPMSDELTREMCERSDSAAATCVALKNRIAFLVGRRRRIMENIRRGLQDGLDVLSRQSGDWISGVGGDGSAYEWFREAGGRIPAMVAAAKEEYTKTTDRLRGLQAAYTQERAMSFALDTSEGGPWYTCCRQIMEGDLPADIWRVYANDVAEHAEGYTDFLHVIRTVSERNHALREQMQSRGAERRTLLALSGDEDWQIACLLAALREDAAWGEQVGTLVDNGFRNEYKALCRRWMEEKELLLRQKEAFEAYRQMYEAYERDAKTYS